MSEAKPSLHNFFEKNHKGCILLPRALPWAALTRPADAGPKTAWARAYDSLRARRGFMRVLYNTR